MSERDDAYGLANKILDRIVGDPDDDLAILSRQLLRHKDRIAQLEAEVARWKEKYEAVATWNDK